MVQTLQTLQTELEIGFWKLASAIAQAILPYRFLLHGAVIAMLLGMLVGFAQAVMR